LHLVNATTTEWRMQAACRGDEPQPDFYPPTHTERKRERLARERRAKMVCAACPVRNDCLDHAVASDERYGVWGGLTADERKLWRESA
jgi:WhiB family redox-sensing transcriptional regulator